MASGISKVKNPGKVVTKTTNPGSPVQAVGGNGKHVPATKQGMAPSGTDITFSGR